MRELEFKILKDSSYSDEISEILNEEDMESLIEIKYIKSPNLFDSLKLDGIEDPLIIIAIDKENKKVAGIGACTILGKNLAYLNSFRIKKEYRNKVSFNLAYKIIINEIRNRGIDRIITSILEENKLAEKLLTKRKKNMPIYEFFRNINFYSIKNIKRGEIKVENDLIIEYKGVKLHLKNKTNKIYIIKDYNKIYRFLYKIRKLINYIGYPLLPKKNEKLDFLYFDITITNEKLIDSEILNTIKFLQNFGFSCEFFTIGVFENSPLENYLKRIKTFKYRSKIYKVYYDKENFNEKEIEFNFWDL